MSLKVIVLYKVLTTKNKSTSDLFKDLKLGDLLRITHETGPLVTLESFDVNLNSKGLIVLDKETLDIQFKKLDIGRTNVFIYYLGNRIFNDCKVKERLASSQASFFKALQPGARFELSCELKANVPHLTVYMKKHTGINTYERLESWVGTISELELELSSFSLLHVVGDVRWWTDEDLTQL